VAEWFESQPTNGGPPATILKLREPQLLAGERTKMEKGDLVTISARDFTFGGPMPNRGEVWLVSIWRDAEGHAVIANALRTRATMRVP
jgi:hypothetical protein